MASAPPAPPCPLLLGGVLGSLGIRGEVGIPTPSSLSSPFPCPPVSGVLESPAIRAIHMCAHESRELFNSKDLKYN